MFIIRFLFKLISLNHIVDEAFFHKLDIHVSEAQQLEKCVHINWDIHIDKWKEI